MKLEAGKYYKTRDGYKVGPAQFESEEDSNGLSWNVPLKTGEYWYYENGESCVGRNSDIVAEWEDPEPKVWGEMSAEEKGALLLAKHEGKTIEVFASWLSPALWISGSDFNCFRTYRVKPESKTETISAVWSYEKGGKEGYLHPKNDKATHTITFDVVDGEPVLDSIVMTKL